MALTFAAFGEAMVEVTLDRDDPTAARIGFAGDTLNTCIYLKRAAPDLDVRFVTRVGQDALSDRLVQTVADEDIATTAIGRSDTRGAGLYAISTDETGERSFAYWRGQSAARDMFSEGPSATDLLKGVDWAYCSAISLAILAPAARARFLEALAAFREGGGKVAFDSNYRPALWEDQATAQEVVAKAWALTDLAMPSVDDEMALYGDGDAWGVVARLKSYGVHDGALKRGAEGPISLGENVGAVSYPEAARVVDTTAAGDSFNAGFLAARLSGASQAEALMAGHTLAARVIGAPGAIIPRADW